MPNIKLTIEYVGTKFAGWQYQENGRTVQAEIERALGQIVQASVRVHGAGRTDAGVHARGQVASVFVKQNVDAGLLMKGLNALLPEDVVVWDVQEVLDEFHARYSAKSRSYEYIIRQQPTAIERRFCWFNTYKLDELLLNRCASQILGAHDFQAFCKADSDAESYDCSLTESRWTCGDSRFVFSVTANRFLYGMVRILVGTMIEVARGYRPYEDFLHNLEAKERSKVGMSAPAQGLFLTRVSY